MRRPAAFVYPEKNDEGNGGEWSMVNGEWKEAAFTIHYSPFTVYRFHFIVPPSSFLFIIH
jgi:hypothetical protein